MPDSESPEYERAAAAALLAYGASEEQIAELRSGFSPTARHCVDVAILEPFSRDTDPRVDAFDAILGIAAAFENIPRIVVGLPPLVDQARQMFNFEWQPRPVAVARKPFYGPFRDRPKAAARPSPQRLQKLARQAERRGRK